MSFPCDCFDSQVHQRELRSRKIAQLHSTGSDDGSTSSTGHSKFFFFFGQNGSCCCIEKAVKTVLHHPNAFFCSGPQQVRSAPHTLTSREGDLFSSLRNNGSSGKSTAAASSNNDKDDTNNDLLKPTTVSGGVGARAIRQLDHFDFVDGIDLQSLGLDPVYNEKNKHRKKTKKNNQHQHQHQRTGSDSNTTQDWFSTASSNDSSDCEANDSDGSTSTSSMKQTETVVPVVTDDAASLPVARPVEDKPRNVVAPNPDSFEERFRKAKRSFQQMIATPAGQRVREPLSLFFFLKDMRHGIRKCTVVE